MVGVPTLAVTADRIKCPAGERASLEKRTKNVPEQRRVRPHPSFGETEIGVQALIRLCVHSS